MKLQKRRLSRDFFFKGKARLKVSGKSKSTLKIGNKKYKLKGRNSELEISRVKLRKQQLTWSRVMPLSYKNWRDYYIAEGSRLEIKKAKTNVKKNFLKTSLLAPFDGREFEFHQTIEISLNWKFCGKATPYELEIADSGFKISLKRRKNLLPRTPQIYQSRVSFTGASKRRSAESKVLNIYYLRTKASKSTVPEDNDYTQILFEENHA